MPFYRSPGPAATATRARASGLAIAKGFIEVNGGRISVESLPGQGTSFVVEFPLSRGARRAEPRGRLMAGERILVCDDDPQILRALRLVLRGAGYEVLTSATAEEALDRAAVGGPHAAIIDLMLPDRPGIEVCRELRSWSELPIIVLSAVDRRADQDRRRCRAAPTTT